MESNLPLVFANGWPTCLDNMSLKELKRFLLYVRKCELQTEMQTSLGNRPLWWPKDIIFDDAILLKTSNKGIWSRNLRKIIKAAYMHYESKFLLDFSSRLMDCFTQEGMATITQNANGTRSMISNNKVIVTFKAENMDYDKEEFCCNSIMPKEQTYGSKQMENNNSFPYNSKLPELYLCENCGADYESLDAVMEHEKNCQQSFNNLNFDSPRSNSSLMSLLSNGVESSSGYSSSTTFSTLNQVIPPPSINEQVLFPLYSVNSQNKFLECFGLYPAETVFEMKDAMLPKVSSYARFVTIDVCSPLGQAIIQGGKIFINEECYNVQSGEIDDKRGYLDRKERKGLRSENPITKPKSEDDYPTDFPTTYKKNKSQSSKQDPFLYSFNSRQRQMRVQVLEKGLSHRTMELMKKMSRRVIRIQLLRSKTMIDSLLPANALNCNSNDQHKLNFNESSKMKQTNAKQNAQTNLKETSKIANFPVQLNFNYQTIKLPKVILPQINQEYERKTYDVEMIDLCSSEED